MIYGLEKEAADSRDLFEQFWKNFRFEDDVLGEPLECFSEQVPKLVSSFAEDLAGGVAQHLSRIDEVIGVAAKNWTLERMARVDLSILRLATFELLFRPETPVTVILNEAIEIGKCFGTKETSSFINGILDRIARTHRQDESAEA